MSAVDRIDRLDARECLRADDGSVSHVAGGVVERVVDVTGSAGWIEARMRAGAKLSLAILVVRAAALALARRPDLHTTVVGYRALTPGTVDIGLSASDLGRGEPLVLPSADHRSIAALTDAVEQASRKTDAPRRPIFGAWIWRRLPGPLGRALLRFFGLSFARLRANAGTFQVSWAAGADLVAPLRVRTGSALGAGRLRETAVVRDGRLETRKVLSLTLAADHVAMDGVRAAALLNEIGGILESDELAGEMA
jgi:pyruvate dehydrogenase E2 component (dihydrolipoamide acetyltransferase)